MFSTISYHIKNHLLKVLVGLMQKGLHTSSEQHAAVDAEQTFEPPLWAQTLILAYTRPLAWVKFHWAINLTWPRSQTDGHLINWRTNSLCLYLEAFGRYLHLSKCQQLKVERKNRYKNILILSTCYNENSMLSAEKTFFLHHLGCTNALLF